MTDDAFSPARVIREARERAGLTRHEVAVAAGLNDDWYFDVEWDDSEVTSNIALSQLGIIARSLGLSPFAILEPGGNAPVRSLRLEDLMRMAAERIASRGMTVEEFSQRVGWEMAEPLRDSQRFRAYAGRSHRSLRRSRRRLARGAHRCNGMTPCSPGTSVWPDVAEYAS